MHRIVTFVSILITAAGASAADLAVSGPGDTGTAPAGAASESTQLSGLRASVSLPMPSTDMIGPTFTLGYLRRLEWSRAFLEAGVGMYLPPFFRKSWEDNAYFGPYVELGGGYVVNPGRTPVYLGGGLRAGFFHRLGELQLLPALYAQAGVALERESSRPVFIELRATKNLGSSYDHIECSTQPGGGMACPTIGQYSPPLELGLSVLFTL
jgi:hypothetical protein